MRNAVVALVIALAPSARAECVTENTEAVALANRGDAVVSVNLDEAISLYEQAFRAASTSPRIASKLAAAYEKKEDWAHAIAVLEKAVALDKDDASLAHRLGRARKRGAAMGTCSYSEAQRAFADAVRIDPNWGQAHFELADVMWLLDDYTGALEHFTDAVKLAPTVAAHWAALADMYRRLGFFEQASKVVAEAPRFLQGDDFDFGRVAGRVHEREGDNAAAIGSYESAKRACGQCAGAQSIVFFDLGRAYLRANRTTEASASLHGFYKTICKGAAAQRYADECTQTQAWLH